MKFGVSSLIVGGSVLALLGAWRNHTAGLQGLRSVGASIANAKMARPRAVENYGQLPLSFEANQGQTDGRVRFLARGEGYTLFLTSQEAVLALQKSEGEGQQDRELKASQELIVDRYTLFNDRSPMATERAKGPDGPQLTNTTLQMKLVGANPKARVKGIDELPGKSNYFIGNDRKKWRTNIATYAKVRVEDVYPGVDLVYYGNRGQLEYDFVVRPGADPSTVKLALVSPASLAKIDVEGDLVVQADGGEVRFHRPVIYQPSSADKREGTTEKTLIAGGYTIDGQKEVAFAIGDYDRTKPLVIDPVLAYSTYLGGSGDDFGNGIAIDSTGNAYVAGQTASTDFPLASPMQAANKGSNAFISKLSADGSALVYSTYLGGTDRTVYGFSCCGANAIAVDSSGNAIVTGQTNALDFPTLNAIQGTYQGFCFNGCTVNAFVSKLNATGSGLVYSTYLGGSGYDLGYGIAVDSADNAYVTGFANSRNFPTTANSYQSTSRASGGDVPSNAFVTKIDTNGSLVYSTYLGGSGNAYRGDWGNGIAVDSSGSAYVTGVAGSLDFPTVNPIQAYEPEGGGGNRNTFVSKLSPDGSALVYSTCLGGASDDWGRGIALDGSGDAYVVATSFVAEVNAAGSALVYSNPSLNGAAIALDGSGNAYIVATAGQSVLEQVNPDGSLGYTFTLDSSGQGGADAIAADSFANVYVTGATKSTAFMTTSNAFQSTNHGGNDAFVAKISPGAADLDIANNAPGVVLSGSTLTYSITVTNNGPDAASNVNIQDAIPAGTNFNSVATTSGSCTAPAPGGAGTVNCTAPALAPGSAITETLTVNVTAGLLTTITDTATVSSATFDPTSNTSATATTTVVGAPSIGGLMGSIGFGKGRHIFY
jgi:uncharacterized repeat protein (TIGR01451 family)